MSLVESSLAIILQLFILKLTIYTGNYTTASYFKTNHLYWQLYYDFLF